MNTPIVPSPAETICSTTPSPSISIVVIEVGIDQGSRTATDKLPKLEELIER